MSDQNEANATYLHVTESEKCGQRVQTPGQPGVHTTRCGKPVVITRVVGWEHRTVHLCEEHAKATDWETVL